MASALVQATVQLYARLLTATERGRKLTLSKRIVHRLEQMTPREQEAYYAAIVEVRRTTPLVLSPAAAAMKMEGDDDEVIEWPS